MWRNIPIEDLLVLGLGSMAFQGFKGFVVVYGIQH